MCELKFHSRRPSIISFENPTNDNKCSSRKKKIKNTSKFVKIKNDNSNEKD